MDSDTMVAQLEYTGWASRKLLEAARGLSAEELTRDLGVSYRSVLGTLTHIFLGDRIWLARVEDQPRRTLADPGEEFDLAALEREWNPILERWVAWAHQADPNLILSYQNLKGVPYQVPQWQIVFHVVNHGTYHRGQVVALLRQLGQTPPATDLIYYYLAR